MEVSVSIATDSRRHPVYRSQGQLRPMATVPNCILPRNVTSFLRPRQDI